MASWADRCEAVWLNATLAAFLVTGFAALAMIQCRQPARRRAWGRLGLLASFGVVLLVVLNPLPRVDLKHPTSILWGAQTRSGSAIALGDPAGASVEGAPGEAVDQATTRDVRPRAESWASVAGRGLLVGYGVGVGVALSRLTLGLVGTRYLVRRARRASGRADQLLGSLPFAGPESRRPHLLTSGLVTRPVLVGVLRPVILVPDDFDRPEAGGGGTAPPRSAPRAGPRRDERSPVQLGRRAGARLLVLSPSSLVDPQPARPGRGIPRRPSCGRPLRDLVPLCRVAGRAGARPIGRGQLGRSGAARLGRRVGPGRLPRRSGLGAWHPRSCSGCRCS